ncbi:MULTISPECIES: DUF5133 domain-containing protein [unclassified Streptomyces]|uniref:DUF5133 domain-containing protein n=1 Tax=Streptomyces TaxID=1883 RepID=UPI0001C1A77F|nr:MULTISPECIES: DUF5133 domain-containing protein [unclassified Streptomyces]MYR66382.1 DUF5133 domain-containing protein [Streptomyces sp. SID4939]MYT66457.1 DUF5133 domain-containing protein [Streptomyces sp. SID8357]MYT83378.1 DUF5133 domain-containing protein [Streptomyces sp. SID8360]MYU34091.1 DUF5133 domain-containing protein [Streptomyces sp. SID8358]MYW35891.1 DUF5133 domain-containing protein [Streptomyces sp. SID1]MYX75953.1 DUF5133 domain-containing protein [Streptomyces sp. SID3
MLTPGPQDLRVALARYADARIEDDRRPTAATARAVEDATRTLCVLTGTLDVPQAIAIADSVLARHSTVLPGPRPAKPRRGDNLQTA